MLEKFICTSRTSDGVMTCPFTIELLSTQYLSPLFEYVEIKNAEAKEAIIKVTANGMRALNELFVFFMCVPKSLATLNSKIYPQSVKSMRNVKTKE